MIYRTVHDPQEGEFKQLVLPECLQQGILHGLHDQLGHQGAERTLLVRSRCYWPGMHKDITSYVKSCNRCVLAKMPHPRVLTSSGNLLANRPLEVLAIDFTVLDPASDGRENVLVMTDVFTTFTHAVPTKHQKATTTAKVLLNEWLLRYGVPQRIHSDQGRNFESDIIRELCFAMGSRNLGPPHIIHKEMGSVSGSIAPYTNSCAHFPQRRREGGLITSQKCSMRTTPLLTLPQDIRRTTCCWAGILASLWIFSLAEKKLMAVPAVPVTGWLPIRHNCKMRT